MNTTIATQAIAMLLLLGISSCHAGPEPLKTGVDHCYFCKMTLSDARFGAEILTKKGKVYKFDDTHCLLNYLKTNDIKASDIKNIYFANYAGSHQLIDSKTALLLQAEALKSPMNGNIAAFDAKDSLLAIQKIIPGNTISWSELYRP